MALTPKLEEGLQLAFHAPGVTLKRGRAGFFNEAQGPDSPAVTIRTANTLVDMGMAEFNDPIVPSSLTLTPYGIKTWRDAHPAAA